MAVTLLLCRQRAGSGALANVLGRHPNISYKGEILDTEFQGSFYSQLDSGIRTPNDFCEAFTKYIHTLRDDDRVNLVDIKYNQLTAFAPRGHSFSHGPWILDVFARLPAPIIHLTRQNYLQSFASAMIAQINGVWHTRNKEDIRIDKVKIDIPVFRNYRRAVTQEDRFFTDFFARYKFSTRLVYEDMYENGAITVEVLERLSKLLSIDLSELDRTPQLIKQAPGSLLSKIENLEEVVEMLSRSGSD